MSVNGILIVSVLAAAMGQDPMMTPEERTSEFIQHALQAETLRVEWSAVQIYNDEGSRYHQTRLKINTQALADGIVPPEDVEPLTKMLDRLRKWERPAPVNPQMSQDYWSDRVRFQWRSLHDPRKWTGQPFPDVVVSAEELARSFRGYVVMSGGLESGEWRLWSGAGKGEGRIAIENPFRTSWDAMFPPLALPEPRWSPETAHGSMVHRIDQFFNYPAVMKRDEGTIVLDGRECQVLSGIFPCDLPNGGSLILRVFIETEASPVPVRVEVFYRKDPVTELSWLPKGTLAAGDVLPFPSEIVRDVVIEEISPGFFYPVSGLIEHYGYTPDHDTYEMNDIPGVVWSKTTWKAAKVEINREMAPEMFAFDFPSGTPYRHEPTGDLLVVDADGYAERMAAGWVDPRGSPAASNWSWGWGGFAMVATTFSGLLVFARRRQQATS